MAAQAISGRLDACPAELTGWLRGRWAEENMFKYDMANYGLDMLADYAADDVVNTKLKANPAYTAAKKAEATAKTALAKAETGLAKLLADPAIPAAAKNSELIPGAQQKIGACQQKLDQPRPNAKSTPRSCPPARSTRPRPGRSCTSTGAACNWSCGCWPPTPSTTSPGTSTPTWTTTTSTGPSPARRSSAGSAAPSPTRPGTSP